MGKMGTPVGVFRKGLLISCVLLACTPRERPLPEVPASADPSGAGSSATATPGTVDAQRWSYAGANGPDHWAELREEYRACGAEEGQSPIDLPLSALGSASLGSASFGQESKAGRQGEAIGQVIQSLGELPLEASSDGRVVRLAGASTQLISIDGKVAELESVELHSPAEHSLGGVTFDLELVLWFKGEAGQSALSFLYRQGQTSPELTPLVDQLPAFGSYEQTVLGGTLALGRLIPDGQELLVYEGSGTVPPCTPGVRRMVLAWVGELSAEQLTALRRSTGAGSARPLQALGNRTVHAVPIVRRDGSVKDAGSPVR